MSTDEPTTSSTTPPPNPDEDEPMEVDDLESESGSSESSENSAEGSSEDASDESDGSDDSKSSASSSSSPKKTSPSPPRRVKPILELRLPSNRKKIAKKPFEPDTTPSKVVKPLITAKSTEPKNDVIESIQRRVEEALSKADADSIEVDVDKVQSELQKRWGGGDSATVSDSDEEDDDFNDDESGSEVSDDEDSSDEQGSSADEEASDEEGVKKEASVEGDEMESGEEAGSSGAEYSDEDASDLDEEDPWDSSLESPNDSSLGEEEYQQYRAMKLAEAAAAKKRLEEAAAIVSAKALETAVPTVPTAPVPKEEEMEISEEEVEADAAENIDFDEEALLDGEEVDEQPLEEDDDAESDDMSGEDYSDESELEDDPIEAAKWREEMDRKLQAHVDEHQRTRAQNPTRVKTPPPRRSPPRFVLKPPPKVAKPPTPPPPPKPVKLPTPPPLLPLKPLPQGPCVKPGVYFRPSPPPEGSAFHKTPALEKLKEQDYGPQEDVKPEVDGQAKSTADIYTDFSLGDFKTILEKHKPKMQLNIFADAPPAVEAPPPPKEPTPLTNPHKDFWPYVKSLYDRHQNGLLTTSDYFALLLKIFAARALDRKSRAPILSRSVLARPDPASLYESDKPRFVPFPRKLFLEKFRQTYADKPNIRSELANLHLWPQVNRLHNKHIGRMRDLLIRRGDILFTYSRKIDVPIYAMAENFFVDEDSNQFVAVVWLRPVAEGAERVEGFHWWAFEKGFYDEKLHPLEDFDFECHRPQAQHYAAPSGFATKVRRKYRRVLANRVRYDLLRRRKDLHASKIDDIIVRRLRKPNPLWIERREAFTRNKNGFEVTRQVIRAGKQSRDQMHYP